MQVALMAIELQPSGCSVFGSSVVVHRWFRWPLSASEFKDFGMAWLEILQRMIYGF